MVDTTEVWHGTVGVAYIVIGLGIIAGVAYLLYGPFTRGNSVTATSTMQTATTTQWAAVPGGVRFECNAGKSVQAVFSQDSVKIMLSDGRQISLPQAMSGSGARYANTDESFVFWNKGNTAFIQEMGQTTYDGCVTQS